MKAFAVQTAYGTDVFHSMQVRTGEYSHLQKSTMYYKH